jgi:hypothetical protein
VPLHLLAGVRALLGTGSGKVVELVAVVFRDSQMEVADAHGLGQRPGADARDGVVGRRRLKE